MCSQAPSRRPGSAFACAVRVTVARAVTRTAGLAGHYRGVSALFLRGGAISGGQLSGYDAAKSGPLPKITKTATTRTTTRTVAGNNLAHVCWVG